MGDRGRQVLIDLLKVAGNDKCADCGRQDPEWASYNLGIFLCKTCAGIHRSFGSHISRVKSVKLDNWDDEQLKMMAENGNEKVNKQYEQHVPICYRRPKPDDPMVILEQFIYAKYDRRDFMDPTHSNLNGAKRGYLWKKGKKSKRFAKRLFILNEPNNTLSYFINDESKDPKAMLRIDQLNMTIVPDKIGHANGMQLVCEQDGYTRNIFVYAEDGQSIIDWYTALRSAKLNRLAIAFPGASIVDMCARISRDFLKEGWLSKTGPRPRDAYRKRWFVLDANKLIYYEDPMDASPKGEILIGPREKGYTAREGTPVGVKTVGCVFTLKTPSRQFYLSATTPEERKEWIESLLLVISDTSNAASEEPKRGWRKTLQTVQNRLTFHKND